MLPDPSILLPVLVAVWAATMAILLIVPSILKNYSPKLAYLATCYSQLLHLGILIAACFIGLHLYGPPQSLWMAYTALALTLLYCVVKRRRRPHSGSQKPSDEE